MDPITHFALGAVVAQSLSPRSIKKHTVWVAGLAAMLPDIDVVFKTSHDVLGHGDLHRSFTHSILFMPVGAAIAAGLFSALPRFKNRFKEIFTWSLLGYATHAFLDACTSYGTQLYWPFSDARASWNFIAIVDPLYSVPLLLGAWLATRKLKVKPARWAFMVRIFI
jgi:inner membrane protein